MTRSNRRTLDDGAPAPDPDQPAPTPIPGEIHDADPVHELVDGTDPETADEIVPETADDVDALGATQEPDAAAPPAAAPPRRLKRREIRAAAREARRAAESDPFDVNRIADRKDHESIRDYITAITSGQPQIKIQVTRREPQSFQGMKCGGLLQSFDYILDEDQIQERFGGGKYLIGVQVRSKDGGQWRFFKATTIDIAGDPKVDHLRNPDGRPSAPPPDKTGDLLLSKALDVVAGHRDQRPPGIDPVTREMLAGLQRQLDAATARADKLADDLTKARSQPTDPHKDRFVEKLIDQDSARIAAIKTQHESEMRTVRDNAREDLKRTEDRHDRELSSTVQRHERELAMMRTGYEREIASLKEAHLRELSTLRQGYDSQIAGQTSHAGLANKLHESENKRLERENDRLAKENIELRAKKDQSIGEKVKELKGIKELLDGDDDDDEKSTIDKIIESPLAGKLFEKMSTVFGGAQQPAQPQIQPGVPYQLNGQLMVNDAQGNARPVRRKAKPAAEQGATGTPPAGSVQVIDPGDVAAATQFMEGAFKSNTDPKDFAASIRNMVPAPILQQLAALGVDDFLDKVAQLDPASPLRSQQGRNWARKVGKALVGGDE